MLPAAFITMLACAYAAPTPNRAESQQEVRPQVKSATLIGNVTDPLVSRDSCGSSRVGDRVFWTCRDTSPYNTTLGQTTFPVVPTTASWSDLAADGPLMQRGDAVGPGSTGSNMINQMYGDNCAFLSTYFPIPEDECPGDGMCDDGTRYVNWPDQPPAITHSSEAGFVGYTWTPRAHLQGLTALDATPAHTLYKSFYLTSDNPNAMPYVSAVDLDFWKPGEIGYGQYGQVVKNDTVYLYGKQGNGDVALAKVHKGKVEDRSAYRFYVNGKWTRQIPGLNDTAAAIDNAGAGGQGTFYHSAYHNSYIWIGQQGLSVSANFMMTTAPTPEGPWLEPWQIYEGEPGDSSLGAYTLQAHPAMLPSGIASENAIYLTWTQQWLAETYPGVYVTPLVYMEFE